MIVYVFDYCNIYGCIPKCLVKHKDFNVGTMIIKKL